MNFIAPRKLRNNIVRNGDLWIRGAFVVVAMITWALH
jgi:hypothetical protein